MRFRGAATLAGAAVGMLAAGAGLGLAAERLVVGRHARSRGGEALGSWRGDPVILKTDDGIELYAEVDEPAARVDEVDQPTAGPDGPPLTVVLCHGYALNLDCWDLQRRALCAAAAGGGLAARLRVVSYDQRSHGRSGRGPASTNTIDRLGADLAAVLDELCPDGPVLLVGHSMGGMTIMALADLHPELFGDRVRGVALIATSAGGLRDVTLGAPAPVGQVVSRLAPAVVAGLARLRDLAEQGRTPGSDVGYLVTRHYGFGSKVPGDRVAFVEAMLAGTPIEVVAEFFPGFATHERYAALEVLRGVETLVIGGVRDLITPIEHSREIADRLPGAAYVELPAGGHMVPIEYPEVVNGALLDLVARLAGAGSGSGRPR